MALFSSKKDPQEILQLREEEDHLSQKIDDLRQFIEEAPQKLQEEIENQRNEMPAPDDLQDRIRERKFQEQLSRGEIKNERRHQARSGLLFLLMLIAIVSLSWWTWSRLQGFSL